MKSRANKMDLSVKPQFMEIYGEGGDRIGWVRGREGTSRYWWILLGAHKTREQRDLKVTNIDHLVLSACTPLWLDVVNELITYDVMVS